jgi:UV DNA damage endonuclease
MMKIGYPCSNLTIECSASRTFRLASYSPEKFIATVEANLDCLERMLRWNMTHGIRFFRISSDTVPFASHPVMTVDWQREFAGRLAELGRLINDAGMRINVHPGQYNILNSPRPDVVERTINELVYHAELLDLFGLDGTHKVQIHTGGVYGDKPAAIEAFIAHYPALPEIVRKRLVIENDERQYTLADNLIIHAATGIPLLFDVFHHRLSNNGESLEEAFDRFIPTWQGHGRPMMDYSSQHPDKQAGAHTPSIDLDDFADVMARLGDREVDVMLEIKDKENSAIRAMALVDQMYPGRAPAIGLAATTGDASLA